jgi:hypothetical protein
MTEHSDEAARRLAPFVPAETDQERRNHQRHAIHRLTVARDAMKLALWAANNATHAASSRLTPAETLADWQAANQMVQTVFNDLSFEVTNAIETIGQMPSSR